MNCAPKFFLRGSARWSFIRLFCAPVLQLKREIENPLEPNLFRPRQVGHGHQESPVRAPPVLVLLPRQVFGVADLPAARFPDFLGRPRTADVHPDLVHRAHVRLGAKNLGVDAADVSDGAVHVVETELRDSADGFGGESRIVVIADVIESVRFALAGVVRVAVQDGAVVGDFARLRLALDPARKNLEADERVLVIGKLKKKAISV